MREVPPRIVVEATEPPSDPIVGRTIAGKYAVLRKLGAGAMGVVYLARQLALEKTVAVKLLHRDLAVDETFTERFRREARAASRLDHPNSIRVFDFGQEPDGLLYLAMEYVEGRDLFTLLSDRGPLSPASIVELLSQVLAALAVAHDLGVLHRDLKPENIMIVRGKGDDLQPVDIVKVCDFGIAKIVDASEPASGDGARRHTTRGLIVGTPEYMSPEQARGEELDGRSDLYAVGVVLYELLTGRVPFVADTPLGIVLKHVAEEPTLPSSHLASVDRALEAICMKALQKKPSERFQSAREMRLALRSALGTSPSPAPSSALLALADTLSDRGPDSSKETLEGLTPVGSVHPPRRSRSWIVMVFAVPAAAMAVVVTLRARMPAESASNLPTAAQAAVFPRASEPPSQPVDSLAPPPTAVPTPTRLPEPVRASDRETKTHRSKAEVSPRAQIASAPIPATPVVANDVPAPASEPPAPIAPAPPPAVAVAPPPTPSPPPEPAAPAYDLASAHVEIGQATGTVGATSSSVTRAVSEAAAQLTGCYRAALPRLTGTIEGRGRVHIETDGAGVITDARLAAPLDAVVARCVAAAIQGRRVANVDTGSASADVPLVFKAH
jgi:eukaryotic-like serine/threonine-protein kinase